MKNESLHRWLTLVANVGVLVGLALVATELRQNLTAVRAQTRHEVASEFSDFMKLLAQDGDLASIRRRGDLGEELGVDETYRYEAFTRGLFRYWEGVHYQSSNDLYEEEEFVKQREAWRAHAATSPGVVAFWCANRTQFSESFGDTYTSLTPAKAC